jgi:NAD(P)-dependent dehydrogenase (short-subunit alcohol dehydrogenase family)
MTKQTYVVTGGDSGLGFECARFLSAGPESVVVLACRTPQKAEQAASKLRAGGGDVRVIPLDLSAQTSVRAFVDAFRRAGLPPLSAIVCNAGGQNVGAPTRTREGFEETFGVNYLGHYLLTRLLLADLQPGGRIVFVSSGTHDPAEKTGLPEPRYASARAVAEDFEDGKEAGRRRYTTSKLCMIYSAHEYARRLERASDPRLRSIRVNAFDPGMMPGTGLARTYPAPLRFAWNYVLPVVFACKRNVHRPAVSGERLASLATDEGAAATGKYFSDGRETKSSPLSYSEANELDLWDASAEMTGLPKDLE